eukprot:scaffold56753_cov45-Attheya_sp.AAC.1
MDQELVQPLSSLSSQTNSLHTNDGRRGWACPCEIYLKQEKERHPPTHNHNNCTVRCRTCVTEKFLGPALARQHEARRQRDAARAAHVDRWQQQQQQQHQQYNQNQQQQQVVPPDVLLSQLRDESD